MIESQDLLDAKRVLSTQLLSAGLRGGVVGRTGTLRASAAIAGAGQNVHAVGVGRKIVEGEVTETLCVRVYVVQKLAQSLLPPIFRIPEEVDGIPTDIIESPPAYAAGPASCSVNRRRRQRPVVGGISAGHIDITVGTLGCFCRSKSSDDDTDGVYALSNNHVFADVNQAHPGDPLLQPGVADGGTPADRFAKLSRFATIQLGGLVTNRVDAAIGRLDEKVSYNPEICRIGPLTGSGRGEEGDRVRKHGRTTGYTEGEIVDESYDALVGMNHADPSVVALFVDQMRIERVAPFASFGEGGDSGSLVVRHDAPVGVGLYFAGPPSGSYGVANHIDDVLQELEIELI